MKLDLDLCVEKFYIFVQKPALRFFESIQRKDSCPFLWKALWKYRSYSGGIHSSGIAVQLSEEVQTGLVDVVGIND